MRPMVFGMAGPRLSPEEKAFFRDVDPAGFIVMGRNIDAPDQVRALTDDLREAVEREHVAILIDQEGGRVQRMGPPHWRAYPPLAIFGRAARQDPALAARALRLNCNLIADDLRRVGITVDCLPLLDVPIAGADAIIGDRALADDPGLVAALGRIVVDALSEAGVLPVIKHIPGHGRGLVDSHKALPVVDTETASLDQSDFMPFRALADAPFAMTAHIVYSDIDPDLPASFSPHVLTKIVREAIGFRGLLMSDDLSMDALDGPIGARAARVVAAGCDLALHCNGIMSEMQEIAEALPEAVESLAPGLERLLSANSRARQIDRGESVERYNQMMSKIEDRFGRVSE